MMESFPFPSAEASTQEIAAELQALLQRIMPTQEAIPMNVAWAWLEASALGQLRSALRTRAAMSVNKKLHTLACTLLHYTTYQVPPLTAEMYTNYKKAFRDYLREEVQPTLQAKHGEELLREFARRWEDHKLMTKWMHIFFRHLTLSIEMGAKKKPSLVSTGLQSFANMGVVRGLGRCSIGQTMIDVITRERDGEVVGTDVVRSTVNMMHTLTVVQARNDLKTVEEVDSVPPTEEGSLYFTLFERPFLDATRAYYAGKAAQWLGSMSTAEYLKMVERVLASEEQRVTRCLLPPTQPKLLAVLQDELLVSRLDDIRDNSAGGIDALLKSNREEDVGRVERLVCVVQNGRLMVAGVLQGVLKEWGMALVDKHNAEVAAGSEASKRLATHDPDFVEALMKLRGRAKSLVAGHFGNHPQMQRALADAFGAIVQAPMPTGSLPDLLSAFADYALRGEVRPKQKLLEAQQDTLLNDLVTLVEHVNDKDMFAEQYRNALARRLLDGKSDSVDAELAMVTRFRVHFGAQFASAMAGMLTDLRLSADLSSKFSEHWQRHGADLGIDFSVTVLSTGCWPSFRALDPALPSELERCVQHFQHFFSQHTESRQLKWVHSQGRMEVRAHLGGRTYELQVVPVQGIALLAFSALPADGQLTFEEVCQRTQLEEDVAKRALHSLSCAKLNVLLKTGDRRAIGSSDSLSVNERFGCKLRRVKLPMPSLTDSSASKKKVLEDRSIAVDAAIVRIMKARKLLTHNELVSEVLHQLRYFQSSPPQIKQRIGTLLDREYLERSAEDRAVYKYLA